MKKEISGLNTTISSANKSDKISNIKRTFTLLDEHPEVGVIVGGTLMGCGISTMAVYGIKFARA